jgi:serine/threonine protein kinase
MFGTDSFLHRDMLHMSSFKIGKFQVLATLGEGAHSKILHVRRSADSKNYALKVVRIDEPEEKKFFQQAKHEFEIAQLLEHPNLIKVYAYEPQRDWLFQVRKVHLLIEYVNGKTLDTFPRLPIAKLVQIFAQVAAGMAHMHRRGVFHADLKPNNVLLSRAGDVKIIDFGLAWRKGEKKDRIQGTPEYMAPEQARRKVVNELTDIYNFGATMYRLVTWRSAPNPLVESKELPLNAATWKNMIKPVRDCAADAPRELCDLIHQCMAFNPGERPERVKDDIAPVLERLVKKLVKSADDHLESLEW